MKFYKNKETNEIINSISEISNENFTKLEANATDGAVEKHVPVYSINDGYIYVNVGSIDHPMSDEHYIMWIALVSGDNITKIDLKPGDKPEGMFEYKSESTIYAYCNLHGLWKTEVK